MRVLIPFVLLALLGCNDEEPVTGPVEPRWTCGSHGWDCQGARIITDPDAGDEHTCYWPCASVTAVDGEELTGRFWVFIDYIEGDDEPCIVNTRFEPGCVKS